MTRKNTGFTLIELMITVAIIGILAAIAYPIYTDQVRKSRRTDAKALLLKAANYEERYYTIHQHYTGKMTEHLNLPKRVPPLPATKTYTVTATTPNVADPQTFAITATAQGNQTNDDCRTMTINQIGAKKAWTGASAKSGKDVSSTCW